MEGCNHSFLIVAVACTLLAAAAALQWLAFERTPLGELISLHAEALG